MTAQVSERLPVNRWPLNRLSKQWLLKANEHPSPDSPYWLQLVHLGLEQKPPVLGPAGGYAQRAKQESAGPLRILNRFPAALSDPDRDMENFAGEPLRQFAGEISLSRVHFWRGLMAHKNNARSARQLINGPSERVHAS